MRRRLRLWRCAALSAPVVFAAVAAAVVLYWPPAFYLAERIVFRLEHPRGSYAKNVHGQLDFYAGKKRIPCPQQDATTGVILVLGQSNSANTGMRPTPRPLPGIVNFHDGACYDGASPLLGGSGVGGSFAPHLAETLIDRGVYRSVVLISAGVGGSSISRWATGDLNVRLRKVLAAAATRYRITDVIWQQGQADARRGTPADQYRRAFRAVRATLRAGGADAPVFGAITTHCRNDGRFDPHNEIATTQRALFSAGEMIYSVNVDALPPRLRSYDGCHFNRHGLWVLAYHYADAIQAHWERTRSITGDRTATAAADDAPEDSTR